MEQQERLERLRRGEAARRKLRALSKATAALLSLYERARHRANAPGGLQYEASKRSFEVATAAEDQRWHAPRAQPASWCNSERMS